MKIKKTAFKWYGILTAFLFVVCVSANIACDFTPPPCTCSCFDPTSGTFYDTGTNPVGACGVPGCIAACDQMQCFFEDLSC